MEYQCPDCPYVYDEEAGDPDNGISPGTKFEDLPTSWGCPICGAENRYEVLFGFAESAENKALFTEMTGLG